MPIYIAKDYDGNIESVVLAKSYDLAYAFWQGRKFFLIMLIFGRKKIWKAILLGWCRLLRQRGR